MKKKLTFVIIFYLYIPLFGGIEERETSPPFRGNFAHTMTPDTTFGFGQNIFEKNSFLFYPLYTQLSGKDFSTIQLTPSFVYAVTDSLSLYAGLPIIVKQKNDGCTQRGIGNLFAQLEYAIL